MLTKQPAVNPYLEVKNNHYPWLDKISKDIDKCIDEYNNLIVTEAEFDKNTNLAHEDFLYDCFKKNVENEEYNGNWEILKYFRLFMHVKFLHYMKGDWTFTVQDKEMYDYFDSIKVNDTIKCKPAKLRIKSGIEPNLEQIFCFGENRNDCIVKYDVKSDYLQEQAYWFLFATWYYSLGNMIRNCKMLSKTGPWNFFNHDFIPVVFDKSYGSTMYNKEYIMLEYGKTPNKTPENNYSYSDFMKALNDYCMKDKTYVKLSTKLTKVYNELKTKFIKENQENYNNLNEHDKQFI